jgi:hypothetical protein
MGICPAGHTSAAEDYCDTCGLPVLVGGPATPARPAVAVATTAPCPHCGTVNAPGALFCEACGYDYTTGTMPRGAATPAVTPAEAPSASPVEAPAPVPAPPAVPISAEQPLRWVAEVWIDPDWYATQGSADPLPSPGLPDVVPLRRASSLIGRRSASRNIHPEVDAALDAGVSRRHAQVSTDGTRWWIEDLESANGTFIGSAAGPLPSMPIARGRVEITGDQRIYLGAWTRIVIRPATEDEQQAFAG